MMPRKPPPSKQRSFHFNGGAPASTGAEPGGFEGMLLGPAGSSARAAPDSALDSDAEPAGFEGLWLGPAGSSTRAAPDSTPDSDAEQGGFEGLLLGPAGSSAQAKHLQ